MAYRFFIYGALGVVMEVFWTGMASLLKKDFRLTSTTSVWMFFIYGAACFLEPVCDSVAAYPLAFRGLVYALCIFAAEYVSGWIMKRLNACPWDYSGARFSVKGIIRLDYAPVWFAVGLIFEFVYRHV